VGHQHHADGTGLPAGSGTAVQGAPIYATKCASCHGENGKGAISSGPRRPRPITSINAAEKTIANFWPYANDPLRLYPAGDAVQQPKTLTSDDVYALTAYILALNQLIGENEVMNATTLPKVRMPNRDGFIIRFPDKL